jgi:hypothetical protein
VTEDVGSTEKTTESKFRVRLTGDQVVYIIVGRAGGQ